MAEIDIKVIKGYLANIAEARNNAVIDTSLTDEEKSSKLAVFDKENDELLQTLDIYRILQPELFQNSLEIVKNNLLNLHDQNISQNLIRNTKFLDLLGIEHSDNIVIEALHPYFKGFSAPYISSTTKPDDYVDDINFATYDNPMYYGAFSVTPDIDGVNKLGSNTSFRSGWNSITANLLRITYDGNGSNFVSFSRDASFIIKDVSFYLSLIAFVESGVLGFGNHLGHSDFDISSDRGLAFDENRWCFKQKELTFDVSNFVESQRNTATIGFKHGDQGIAYIALPRFSLIGNSKDYQIL